MMRIECLGLPGSGKSTVLKASRIKAKKEGQHALNADELDKLDAEHPPGFRHFWGEARLRQSFHIARFLETHNAFYQFCSQLYRSNYRNLGLILNTGADLSRHDMLGSHFVSLWVDEGFMHLGSHAILEATGWDSTKYGEYLEPFCELLPRPDVVIFVSSSVETARKGIFSRMPDHSVSHANRRYINAFGGDHGMHARAHLIDDLVMNLEMDGVPIIELEGHTSLDDMCDYTTERIGALLESDSKLSCDISCDEAR